MAVFMVVIVPVILLMIVCMPVVVIMIRCVIVYPDVPASRMIRVHGFQTSPGLIIVHEF